MKLCYKEMSYAKAIRAVFRLHSFTAALVLGSSMTIALNDHEDERKNKVGRIKDDELFLLDFIDPCSKFRLEQTASKRLGEESRIRKKTDQICNWCRSSGFLISGIFCVDVNFLL